LGNRIHFGLHAYGDTQFTLADVNYQLTSNDGNLLGTSGTLASTTFNGTSRIGIDWGMDGIGGTPDDIVYNNNEGNSTLVNELIYIGVGNGYWPGGDDPTPANPAIGKQESIDGTYEWVS